MSAPDISVVICAYTERRWAALLAAIDSARGQSLPPREIIVVIDHNPRLLARLRARALPIVALESGATRGLSGARNCGVAAASGAIVAFLDDDAVAAPDWLAGLAAAYDDARVLGVGGAIEPLWVEPPPAWFPPEFGWTVGCDYTGLPATTATVRNLVGANMSLRRAVFARVGGFHGGMGRVGTTPLGCEETELCLRLARREPDAILRREPRARVRHLVTPERLRPRYFLARCWSEGRSKALVAGLAGTEAGLASERAYTLRVLPVGVLRGLRDAALGGQPGGLGRAAAIVAGLATTTAGYLVGRLALRATARPLSHPPALALEEAR